MYSSHPLLRVVRLAPVRVVAIALNTAYKDTQAAEQSPKPNQKQTYLAVI